MTTENLNVTPEPVVDPSMPVRRTRRKSDKPRKKMTDARKADHHVARDLVVAAFAANPALKEEWTSLFPGRQLRVISNLLLDYVPSFVATFQAGASSEFIARCSAFLREVSIDVPAYRKNHKTLFVQELQQQAPTEQVRSHV